jgi:hypothetical protein
MAASRMKSTPFLGSCYACLVPRLGTNKALVAVEPSVLTGVWHVLSEDVDYQELGGDYFARRDPERATRRAVQARDVLGYTVTLNPIAAA